MKYLQPKFTSKKRFNVGQCTEKGKKGYCNGKYNYPRCPVKYAFFGLIACFKGWKNYECIDDENETCPEYVEWGIIFKGKEEFIGIIDGGQLPGFKPKGKGPCIFQVMESTEPEILEILGKLFSLVPKGENAITKYLKKELGAPDDIREQALKIAMHRNEPKFKK